MSRIKTLALIFAVVVAGSASAQSQLPSCAGKDAKRWTNCQGVINFTDGDRYEGEVKVSSIRQGCTLFCSDVSVFKGFVFIDIAMLKLLTNFN